MRPFVKTGNVWIKISNIIQRAFKVYTFLIHTRNNTCTYIYIYTLRVRNKYEVLGSRL